MKRNSKRSKSCNVCIEQGRHCSHPPPSLMENLTELKRKHCVKAFSIIIPLFFIAQFTGMQAIDPFLMHIFDAYKSPISPGNAAAVMKFIEISVKKLILDIKNSFDFQQISFQLLLPIFNLFFQANLLLLFLIRFGKRRVYLITGFGVFLSSLATACYGFIYLPNIFNSSHQQNQNPNLAYIPTVGLFLWCFFSKCGFLSMPMLLASEVFSFK